MVGLLLRARAEMMWTHVPSESSEHGQPLLEAVSRLPGDTMRKRVCIIRLHVEQFTSGSISISTVPQNRTSIPHHARVVWNVWSSPLRHYGSVARCIQYRAVASDKGVM